ncbi:MAG: glycosyltransferase family 2 protein [Acidobacteriota bacterium]
MISSVDTSVVVPVFKNAETVLELYRRVATVLQSLGGTWELIFVDDASPDGSLQHLRKLAQEDPRVVVLALAENVGQHRAVWLGLQRARGQMVAVMDADLQDPPEALPAVLRALQDAGAEKPTVVFAGRQGRYQSWPRMVTSRFFKHLLHLWLGLPADAGLFCVMNRKAVACLARWDVPRPYLQVMLACAGASFVSLPVTRPLRPAGVSSYSSWRRLVLALRALGLALRLKLHMPPRGRAPWPIRECIGGSSEHEKRSWEVFRDAS